MLVHITKVETINAKKSGLVWVKISAISAENGEVVEAMIEATKLGAVEDVQKAALSPEELKEALGGFEPVHIFFDKRGRLDSVQA